MLRRLVICLAVWVPFGWCFAATLTGHRLLAYRDTISFYYPSYRWISDRWAEGELPLWNPQSDLGTPVVAESTSAVFYPGKLLFVLPLCYELRFTLYVVGHLLLAFATVFWLARSWRLSNPAAGLSAASYAFGGVVLFQYCNVVFLVGAAWLPVSLLAIDQMLRKKSVRWALGLGISLACMTLGGDPQTAYHAGLVAGLGLFFLRSTSDLPVPSAGESAWPSDSALTPNRTSSGQSLGATRLVGKRQQNRYQCRRWLFRCPCPLVVSNALRKPFGLLLIAVASSAVLAAVQIVPSSMMARDSNRATFRFPRNVYEIPDYLARHHKTTGPGRSDQNGMTDQGGQEGPLAGIFGEPVADTHHRYLYHFSVTPWRIVEAVWPNFTGRIFPENRRWLRALRAEGRIWTPSLYFGIVPLLLALRMFRLRKPKNVPSDLPDNVGGRWRSAELAKTVPQVATRQRVRWLSWVVVCGLLGSFGWYGPVWLVEEISRLWIGNPIEVGLGQPTGGLYWVMVTFLPGYVYFRYPAKLLVVACLGLSLLAGLGLDRMLLHGRGVFRRQLVVAATLSLFVGLAVVVGQPLERLPIPVTKPDELFGPFHPQLAQWDAVKACLHTTTICGFLWWLIGRRSWRASTLGYLILLVTSIELAVANGGLVLTAPTDALRTGRERNRQLLPDQLAGRDPPSEQEIGTERPAGAPTRFYRPASRRWVPSKWLQRSSPERASQVLTWDRQTWYPNYHLLDSHASLTTQNSIILRDYSAVLNAGGQEGPHPAILDLLGTEILFLPFGQKRTGHGSEFQPLVASHSDQLCSWYNPRALPRAWIVHQVQCVQRVDRSDPWGIARSTEQLLLPEGRPRDFRRSAVIEFDSEARGLEPVSARWDLRGDARADSDLAADVAVTKRPGHLIIDGLGPATVAGLPDESCEISCEIIAYRPQRVEIDAVMTGPGLVVLSDQFHTGWRVDVSTDGQPARRHPIYRTNRVMRGVLLDTGHHRLVFRYVPRPLLIALPISATAWLVCLVWLSAVAFRSSNCSLPGGSKQTRNHRHG